MNWHVNPKDLPLLAEPTRTIDGRALLRGVALGFACLLVGWLAMVMFA